MIMQKRDFLLMLKRLQLIDPTHLTASRIISILAEDDPNIRPLGSTDTTDIRLDIEASFLFVDSIFDIEHSISIFRCVFSSFSKH